MKHSILLFTLGLLLAGCSVPENAYVKRGQPESLLDISSERVSFNLDSPVAVQELTSWVDNDQPDRAELNCAASNSLCENAQDVLDSFAVPFEIGFSNKTPHHTIVLVYERVIARDCQNTFQSNHRNAHNFNHKAFGCSNAVNMLQMIGDRQQIYAPVLVDYQDAEQALKRYKW